MFFYDVKQAKTYDLFFVILILKIIFWGEIWSGISKFAKEILIFVTKFMNMQATEA